MLEMKMQEDIILDVWVPYIYGSKTFLTAL